MLKTKQGKVYHGSTLTFKDDELSDLVKAAREMEAAQSRERFIFEAIISAMILALTAAFIWATH